MSSAIDPTPIWDLAVSDAESDVLPYGRQQVPIPANAYFRSTQVSPQQWENRYIAWQSRDRQLKEQAAKLEAEQIKLFGGVPGDDVGLCSKMLEYFGGLDFIDSVD